MNDKKMTAVEWLYFELWKQTDFSIPTNLLDKAKEIEKQQIENAYESGGVDGQIFAFTRKIKYENSEQYYKETYER